MSHNRRLLRSARLLRAKHQDVQVYHSIADENASLMVFDTIAHVTAE